MATEDSPRPASPPELIVMMQPEAALRASASRFESAAGANLGDIEKILKRHKASMVPLFGITEERVIGELSRGMRLEAVPQDDLSLFYHVWADERRLPEIAAALAGQELVAAAYVKPPAEPADLNRDLAPAAEEAPPVTPDFESRQLYLDASPTGVDARWAWGRAGGRGDDVRIIDIEGAWRFTHEDLQQNEGGLVGGTESAELDWRNHGTAVIGVYGADANGTGVVGIAPNARSAAIAIFGGMGSALAIRTAAGRLRPGDVILIELHRPGPRHNFAQRDDQRGYVAIEWWEDDFAAIRFAVNRGVVVVEAAGNGAENLDDNLYQARPENFPASWTNPFRRTNRDSGAIVVGAGAPPPGTHGRNHGPDRSRLDFSNWGALVDAQGWGREVTTCGYGDLQGGSNEDVWYTDRFSGTSSASPVVVGAVACIQGMARGRGAAPLTPGRMRDCLRSTGAPQTDAPGRPRTQRIGSRPDIRALHACAFGAVVKNFKESKDIKEKDVKELKEKDIKELKEKDGKEIKEKDLKDKELKDKDKEGKEKDAFEKEREIRDLGKLGEVGGRPGPAGGGDLEARLAALEQAVGEIRHFISAELRPDLAGAAQRYAARDQAEAYRREKEAKDAKDNETGI
jgi:Subtilase family